MDTGYARIETGKRIPSDRKRPNVNRRLIMKYSKAERLEIGRRIYTGELTRYEAGEKYGISSNTARDYMRLYRDTYDLPAKRGTPKNCLSAAGQTASSAGLEELKAMSKEELIHELLMVRIHEERLKKGYEVKGDGTVILYGKENTKLS